jgi:hypothetical protein
MKEQQIDRETLIELDTQAIVDNVQRGVDTVEDILNVKQTELAKDSPDQDFLISLDNALTTLQA